MSEGRGWPADLVHPDKDLNYKMAYNEICYEAWCLDEKERQEKREQQRKQKYL